jgi:hypothetical protein
MECIAFYRQDAGKLSIGVCGTLLSFTCLSSVSHPPSIYPLENYTLVVKMQVEQREQLPQPDSECKHDTQIKNH